MDLAQFFYNHSKLALAFSGGCDSAYLLGAAVKYGCDIKPYFVKSAFQPQFELDDALRLGKQLGISVSVIHADILAQPSIAANPANRCYYCKQQVMRRIREQSLADGYTILIDGANASDDISDRPGMKAAEEAGILSPLRQCGITKTAVRRYSNELGLFTWDKPSYACLATRIPTDQPITAALLIAVEQSENELRKLGFTDFRIRVYHDAARLQLKARDLLAAIQQREIIRQKLQPYFAIVLLDLAER